MTQTNPAMSDQLYNLTQSLGVAIPELYVPKEGIDLARWAVVACDQYTSQPDY